MTKATEQLVERVVIGPKVIHYHDPKTGDRVVGNIGDTIKLPHRSAVAFAQYLQAPEVAAAQAEVEAAEARAAQVAAESKAEATSASNASGNAQPPKGPAPKPPGGPGGGSSES